MWNLNLIHIHVEEGQRQKGTEGRRRVGSSATRLGDLLDFEQPFKAFGNN